MNNMKKPRIRFKGFTDDWEQRKLGDLMDVGSVKRVHQSDWRDSGVRFLRARDVVADFNNEEPDDYLYIDQKMYEEYSAQSGKVQQGDLLVTGVGTIGIPMLIKSEKPLYFKDGNIIWFKNKNAIDGQFFYYSFISKGIQDFIKESAGIGTVGTYTIDSGKKTPINLPTSIEEQKKIGAFLESIDNVITLHQRKYEKLQIIKKSMLENCFPKNGEKVPKIRFSGFTGDWEQRKLLDCIQKITDFRGRTPKKLGMDWSEEGYLALSALNVKDGYIDFNQDIHYGNQELYDKWMTGNELHKGQVLFTTEAPMGNVAQVPDNRRYILSQRVIALDVKDNLLTENFLATVLRTPTVFAYLTALSSGGTAKGVSQKSLSSVEIRLPKNLKEQEKIADTFSNLDHIITLHQSELEKLQKIKKSLLERMFV